MKELNALREKFPILEFFLVCIFRNQTENFKTSVLSRITGKYGPGKTSYSETFHAMI